MWFRHWLLTSLFFQDSFSAEEIWDSENVDSRRVTKWVASKLKSIAATIGVAFAGYESYFLELKRIVLDVGCLNRVCKEHLQQLEGKES